MVADGVAFVGGVGEAVLVTEVFVNFGVDFVERLFFGGFEEAAAGFLGNLLEDFLAVGALLLRIPWLIRVTRSFRSVRAAVVVQICFADAVMCLRRIISKDRQLTMKPQGADLGSVLKTYTPGTLFVTMPESTPLVDKVNCLSLIHI